MSSLRALLLALLIAGCSAYGAVPPTVDNQQVVPLVQSCEAVPELYVDPPAYLEVGFTNIDIACRGFFDKLTEATQRSRIAKSALADASLAATAIINATNPAAAAAKAITITSAGVILTNQLIDNYAQTYAYSPYLYKIRQLVIDSMEDFKTKSRVAAKSFALKSPDNYCRAYTYIVDYASLCTVSAIQARFDEQMALPSTAVNKPATPATTSTSGRSLPRGRSLTLVSPARPSVNYTVQPSQ